MPTPSEQSPATETDPRLRDVPDYWLGHFQKALDDPNNWKPEIMVSALERRVLVVAKTRLEPGWAAYIGACDGVNHDNEWQDVAARGSKLDERIARVIFPQFEGLRYIR